MEKTWEQILEKIIVDKFGFDTWSQVCLYGETESAPTAFNQKAKPLKNPQTLHFTGDKEQKLLAGLKATLNADPELLVEVFGKYWVQDLIKENRSLLHNPGGIAQLIQIIQELPVADKAWLVEMNLVATQDQENAFLLSIKKPKEDPWFPFVLAALREGSHYFKENVSINIS